MDLPALLRKWGLERYVQSFTDQDWTVESIHLITDTSLNLLIPKEGPRTVFRHHLEIWKNNINNLDGSLNEEDLDDPIENIPLATRRKQLDNGQLQLVLKEPDINDLHKYLKKSVPGIIILSYYKAHQSLDNYARDLLCTQVLHKELENDFTRQIIRDQFNSIAERILEIFPNESKETWYDVVQKGKATTIEGRLRHKYYSLRKALISASLIPKAVVEDTLVDDEGLDDNVDDENDESFMWLLNNTQPWEEVLEKWEETRPRRKKHLRLSSKTFEYVKKFPCLENALGWKLIASDGIHEQPNLDNSLRESWVNYSTFLLKLIRQENPNFLKGRKFTSLSTDQQFVAIFLELPSLFKVRNVPKSPSAGKREKSWRPSRSEVLEGLCLHVEEIPEIQEKLNDRKKLLQKYKFSLQAVPVFLGPLSNIRQSFIVLDDQRWEVSCPFEAIEAFFKLTFGLGSEYPIEARHIWVFLQQTLYNIKTCHDFSRDPGLRSFISSRIKDYELFCSK